MLWALLLPPSAWAADMRYVVKPIAEMKVKQLPQGPLYWRVENFPTLESGEGRRGRVPLGEVRRVAIANGRSRRQSMAVHTWGARCGDAGRNEGGRNRTRTAHIRTRVPPAHQLRKRTAGGQDTGPFTFGLRGLLRRRRETKLGQRTPHGVSYVEAGHAMNGHMAGMPMEVFNGGTTDLTALIMFVVDATKPFSVPASLP
jgi:hypothetical protein